MSSNTYSIKQALKRWNNLAPEKQQELLKLCTSGNIIELDQNGGAKVVSVFFGWDLSINSPYEYLFPDDIQ